MRCSDIGHHSDGRAAKHVLHAEVDRAHAVFVFKYETVVACGLAHNVEWSTLAVGDLADMVDVFFLNHHTHALLRLIADNLLERERGVANG